VLFVFKNLSLQPKNIKTKKSKNIIIKELIVK